MPAANAAGKRSARSPRAIVKLGVFMKSFSNRYTFQIVLPIMAFFVMEGLNPLLVQGATIPTITLPKKTITIFDLIIKKPTGNPVISGLADNEFAYTGPLGVAEAPVEAGIRPLKVEGNIENLIKWTFALIPIGSVLTWNNPWPGESTAGKGKSVVATLTGYPSSNTSFGARTIKTEVIRNAVSLLNKVFTIRLFFEREAVAIPRSVPNWFFYWSSALGYQGQFIYNAALSTSQTVVNSATSWQIQIAPNAQWPGAGGNPPTGNRFINGFKATVLHEFWHRDHRVHNYSVHGSWDPPPAEDLDGDGLCDREPGDPPGHTGGYEAMIGTSYNQPDSTEVGGDWAESNGTYGHEGIDWAYPGSQREP